MTGRVCTLVHWAPSAQYGWARSAEIRGSANHDIEQPLVCFRMPPPHVCLVKSAKLSVLTLCSISKSTSNCTTQRGGTARNLRAVLYRPYGFSSGEDGPDLAVTGPVWGEPACRSFLSRLDQFVSDTTGPRATSPESVRLSMIWTSANDRFDSTSRSSM